jgi:hypothetical protein
MAEVVVSGGWEARRFHVGGVGWGERSETWGVRGGLRAQLGEVEIGTGFVTDIHGFAQLTFRVVAVEDNAIDDNGDGFNDYFDDAANERPGLQHISWRF